MTDPRVEKLPKWAQDLILNQSRQIDNGVRDLKKLKGDSEVGCKGNVYRGYAHNDMQINLPDNDHYFFKMECGVFHVRRDEEIDGLLVMANRGRMRIYPQSSNSIILRQKI